MCKMNENGVNVTRRVRVEALPWFFYVVAGCLLGTCLNFLVMCGVVHTMHAELQRIVRVLENSAVLRVICLPENVSGFAENVYTPKTGFHLNKNEKFAQIYENSLGRGGPVPGPGDIPVSWPE